MFFLKSHHKYSENDIQLVIMTLRLSLQHKTAATNELKLLLCSPCKIYSANTYVGKESEKETDTCVTESLCCNYVPI